MGRRFKTGTVARRLGMTAPLLRIWEQRYALVEPQRGPGGQRLYTEEDVTLLEAVRVLVQGGHTIGELATWSRRDVLRAAHDAAPIELRVPAPRVDISEEPPHAVAVTLEREGRIAIVSPNVEALLGWPYGLLVGQPIWGLLLDPPPELLHAIAGQVRSEKNNVFWVWMRARSGAPLPCRIACGIARRQRDGTAITLSVSPLAAHGLDALSHVLGTLERHQIGRAPTSRAAVFKAWADRAVHEHDAALARAWTYDADDNTLRLVVSAGLSRAVRTSSRAVIQLGSYPYKVGAVARTGIPYLHNGLAGDRDFDPGWVRAQKLESAAVLPITARGALLGVVAQFFRRRLASEDIGVVQASTAVLGATVATLRE